MISEDSVGIACLSVEGDRVATLVLVPDMPEAVTVELAAILRMTPDAAVEYGETEIQLRENGRYYYELEHNDARRDLRLRCHLAHRRRSLKPDAFDSGKIETGSFCGLLLFEVVEGWGDDPTKPALASALVDVRSVKLNYRLEYRAMLQNVAARMADLIADARHSSKASFQSNFEDRNDAGWFQVQLELLREILESSEFKGAMQRIFAYPHEMLEEAVEMSPVERTMKWTSNATRALISSPVRRAVPLEHPMRFTSGITSVAERIPSYRKTSTLDTSENRFIKFILLEFHGFLLRAQRVFSEAGSAWSSAEGLTTRLSLNVEQWLARPFFKQMSAYPVAGIRSPVLQRKPGYREMLRWWLRYRTAAELSWRGGENLFRAGQRNVAELYEYWLFFVLLDWFGERFNREGQPSLVEDLVDGLDDGLPNLRLKHRNQLGPFSGKFSGLNRQMYASFSYNLEFPVTTERAEGGSWTRKMHPDYTFTFWPAIDGMTADEAAKLADAQELLVHIHFDAKYRVESLESLFGTSQIDVEEGSDQAAVDNYKRQDLLKMHAYRDAIKRSEGAYILYPGSNAHTVDKSDAFDSGFPANIMTGFHEILPGLGAFAVAPNVEGGVQGFDSVAQFLEAVLKNVCDRASLREQRASALFELLRERRSLQTTSVNERPDVMLRGVQELDTDGLRFPTPQQVIVAIGWASNNAERDWMLKERFAVLRLGEPRHLLNRSSSLAAATHLLLRGPSTETVSGLYSIDVANGEVWTGSELETLDFPVSDADASTDMFAVVPMEIDTRFNDLPRWDGDKIEIALVHFSERQRPTYAKRLDQARGDQTKPQIISLHDLQTALNE